MDRRRPKMPYLDKRDPTGARDRRRPEGAIFRKTWDLAKISQQFTPTGAECAAVRAFISAYRASMNRLLWEKAQPVRPNLAGGCPNMEA